jgi:thioredoxin reductase (NADPH)
LDIGHWTVNLENRFVKSVDCIIIGAGPIGLAAGIELKKRGISFEIIEKGCLVNSIYKYPVNMTFFSTSERLELGGVPFISHGVKPNRREALEYYRRVADAFELPVRLYEEVQSVSKADDGRFCLTTSKGQYACKHLIVSTGFYTQPNLMGVPGEDLAKVRHYFDEPHPYARQKVLVVGGGNSAVDVALETWRCGAEVCMVVREGALKDGVKYWVRPDIENRINEGSITCWYHSQIDRIDE